MRWCVTPSTHPPLPCVICFSRTLGRSLGRDSRRRQLVSPDPCICNYTFLNVNLHPRAGTSPRADVRDLRISPLSQEVSVRPLAFFGLLLISLFPSIIVLALPYFSDTLCGAYTILYIIRVLESRPCMYRRIRLYTERNMQEEVGAWRMPFVLSCVYKGWGSGFLVIKPVPHPGCVLRWSFVVHSRLSWAIHLAT
jgi:hypothetical protein